MGVILYDCTRLIERRKAVTPTGIDRVDIHYLNHLLKTYPDTLVGVVQYGPRMVAMSREEVYELRNTLTLRWIDPDSQSIEENPKLDVAYSRGKSLAQSLEKLPGQPIIHPDILEHLAKPSMLKPVYVSASHLGLDKEALMFAIKTYLQCQVALFVHDIIPIDFPEYVAAGGDAIHKNRMWNVSAIADLVIVNSQYTKDRVEAFCAAYNSRCPDIEILYIGADKQFKDAVIDPNHVMAGRKYFVSVGTIEPRKNHIMLLNIWRRWIEEDSNAPYLVLIGKRGWEIKTVTNMLDLSPALRSRVIEMSGLSDQDMVSILKGSQGLVFPTFVEGWGMPLAEALSLGVGAVCSDISVFRECGQNLPTYIDPLDSMSWLAELKRIHNEPEVQQALHAQAAKYVSPNWETHMEQLSVLIAGLAEKSEVENVDVKGGQVRLEIKRTEADRLRELHDVAMQQQQELIASQPEVYNPNGLTFENRYKLLGNARCLRLAAEAYVQEGRIEDAIRVLEIAKTSNSKKRNIAKRIFVLKHPRFEKFLGSARFEPYYYGKFEVVSD